MVSKKTKTKRAKILTKCSDIAKDLLSISHVEDAEKVLVLALSLHPDDASQGLLDQIRNEKIKVKPNRPSQIQFDKDDLERQKQLEIKAKKQLENTPYAEMNTNRFKMRANVLSLEVSVILKKYENDIANVANTTSIPVSLNIENLLQKTHNAIDLTDLGEAEKHLLEAERIYNDAYAKIPKIKSKTNNDTTPVVTELVIPKHTPGAREKAELKGNEGDENRCIRIAQTAMKDEDYAKAEKFLLKAERLRSTIVAKKLLIVVRDLASKKKSAETITSKSHEPAKDLNTTGEDNQQLAVTLTKLAKSRINDKNYEGAKTVLERAEQLFPTTAAKNLLQKIIETQTKKEASGASNSLPEKGLKLLSDAQCMENHGKLDSAEKYLSKAEKLWPENYDVSKALVRIRNAKAIDPITKEPAQPIATSSEEPESLVSPGERNISEARTAMELGNFDDAEKIILDLKDNYPNEDVTEIQSKIRAARASRSSTEEFNDAKGACAQPDSKNIQSSNNYIARAQHALTTGELDKAEEYLLKARNYYPSKTLTTLLNHVQEQIGENKTKQEKEMKRVEAEKHIQNAHKAFCEGNLETAEVQLLKAKELHPQEHIEVLLRDVYAAKIAVSSPKSRLRSGKEWKDPSTTHQEKSVANEEEEEQVDTATIEKPKEVGNSNQRTGVHKDGKADRTKADKPQANRTEADRPQADRTETDRPQADRTKADRPQADGTEADRPQADRTKADIPQADRTEADRPKAHRQRPETHMEASAQNYKHIRTPSPYSMAHCVEKVSVKIIETKIESTKAQKKITGTSKRGVSVKKDKYLESNANNNKTNTLGTKSRNELTKIETKEQVDTAIIKKPKEDGNSNQRTGVHKDGEADRTEAYRQRPETHNMEASAQNYKHKRTPSPYSMAHRVEKVSVKMSETKIDSTKAQEKFTGTSKRGVSVKKDKYLETNAKDNKTNTLGTKSRNEFKTIEDLKREEAESCINVAQTALSSGNLEKSKCLLDKAERIFPTEQAKRLLEDISLMKTKNNTKDNNYQPSTSSASNREIEDDVDTLINMAFEYIDIKQLNEAKLFFEIANRLSPGDYTADLLDQIKTKIKHEEEFSTPVKKGKKHNQGKDKKIEAEYFVAMGEKALNAGETRKAEATFIVASSLKQNKRVDELLEKVRQSPNAKPVGSLNDYKSAEYIRMGTNAIDIENFVLAEHFLVKAQTLSPSEATKILLKKVVEAKNNVYASKKPAWSKVLSYMWL